MNLRHDIKAGDLVAWQVDLVCGEITETGIVVEVTSDDDGNPGAKVNWQAGVYWSPIALIRNIRDFL